MDNRDLARWSVLLAAAFVLVFVLLITYEFSRGGSPEKIPAPGQSAVQVSEEETPGVPGRTIVLEAEHAVLTGLTTGTDGVASGGQFVEGFDSGGDTLAFELHLDAPGTYMIKLRYRTFGGDKPNTLLLNGSAIGDYTFRDAPEWQDALIGQYELTEGHNSFVIASTWGWIAVDNVAFIGGPGGPVSSVGLHTGDGMREGAADKPVMLTAEADNAAEFRFHVRKVGEAWEPINDYSRSHTVVWLPPAVGSYELKTTARGLGSDLEAEQSAALSYKAFPAHAGKPLVSPVFSDRMVLQRDRETAVWGWAEPGTAVRIEIDGRMFEAMADGSGRWMGEVGIFEAGGPYTMTVSSSGGESVTFKDVLFGDVWLASGQSNMEWRLSQSINAAAEITEADYPAIRYIQYPSRPSAVPLTLPDSRHEWQAVTPQTAAELSGVAYFFARKVHAETGVPIGIVQAAVGGTKAEPWMSLETAREVPGLAGPAAAIRIGEAPIETMTSPTALYNGMIAPIAPYGLKGVLWYQGESNGGDPGYHKLLPSLMEDWRSTFNEPELPFIIMQLSAYGSVQSENMPVQPNAGFPVVREAQLTVTEADPYACLVVTTDVGNPTDIHPTNKQDVGDRAARCALGSVYGMPVAHSGPVLDVMTVEGDRIRLTFKEAESGLMAGMKAGLEPVKPAPDGRLIGFAVAGDDGRYVWADAVIDGRDVIVSSAEVADPLHVRYGWADAPIGNLYNGDGLPASPFRTDVTPVLAVTEGAGGGSYAPGQTVEVIAYPPKEGRFVRWVGDIEHLADPNERKTTVLIPDAPYMTLAPQYTRD